MSDLQPSGGNPPSQNVSVIVKHTKKKHKNKQFVNHNNASSPSPPPNGYRPYYGYRRFNGMSLRPNVDGSSRGVGNYKGRHNAPLFFNPNIEVHQVSPVSSNDPHPDPARRRPLLPTPPTGPPRFVRFPPRRPPPGFTSPPRRPPPGFTSPPRRPPPGFTSPPPRFSSPPPRFSSPPPRFSSPTPRFSSPPPRFSSPPPLFSSPPPGFPFAPPYPPPRLPFFTPPPALPSNSKGAAAETTHATDMKPSKKVSFGKNLEIIQPSRIRAKGNSLPYQQSPLLPPPPSEPEPEPEPVEPFKLSEKTRVHLQLQLQEIAKRYEKRDPEESTWEPAPAELLKKLGIKNIQDDEDNNEEENEDEADVTPSTSSGSTEHQDTTEFQEPVIFDAYQKPYDILIEDPFQKDANINYAERYPNLTNVKALCLFQPASDDEDDYYDE